MIDRRAFLKTTLAAGALASLPPVLQGCGGGIKRGDLDSGNPEDAVPALTPDGAAILRYASLAPSGHNAQPWAVRILKEDEWIVEADPSRRLPAVDPENRELLLSLGAFTENLVTAAGALGYRARVTVIGQDPFARDMVHVRLEKAEPSAYLLKRLETRRTVKRGLQDRELRDEEVRALANPFEGRLFYFPRGTTHAECIREGAVESFRVQSLRDAAQKELAQWVRFSNRAAREHRDGLTTEGMEITGFSGWYVRHFMDPEDVLSKGFRERGIDGTAELAAEGAGWFIVTSEGSSVSDLIDTGRRFERMALLARERGVGIHPMTQVLEEDVGRRRIQENHPSGITPQFVLRVGTISPYPDPVSLRRPVAWFLRT